MSYFLSLSALPLGSRTYWKTKEKSTVVEYFVFRNFVTQHTVICALHVERAQFVGIKN